jgi:beta-1,4-N-acetylglucosaminyltransferase
MGVSPPLFPQGTIWRPFSVTTFVSVGNGTEPFQRLINAVLGLAPRLPQPVIVQHGHTPFAGGDCVARDFVDMEEFARAVADAQLLILHGGAGSIIHALLLGKVPVVMPRLSQYREIVDDHQLEFARLLSESDRIVLAPEPTDLAQAVSEAMNRKRCRRSISSDSPMINLLKRALHTHAAQLQRPFSTPCRRKT